MEKRICVSVKVSSEEHADIIRDEIEAAVMKRTCIYHVGVPHENKITIDQIGEGIINQVVSEVIPEEWERR